MSDAVAPVDVTVVVVSYNALEWLEKCLASIGTAHSDRYTVEVVVVDNLSAQPVRDFLAGGPSGVTSILMDENVGFGRACNIGAAGGTGRHIMLLNPDAILQPGAIDALLEAHAEWPNAGLVGGRTFRPDGTLERGSCYGLPSLWSWFCSAVGLTAVFRFSLLFDPESLGRWERDTRREVGIVTGCLVLTSREIWQELDGFDPDYFMYGEDADLSRRAWELGYKQIITPQAVVVHAVGASSPNRLSRERMLITGKATYARKNWRGMRVRAGLGLLAVRVGLRGAAEFVLRRESRTMRTLWQERRSWSAGWPPRHRESPQPYTLR